MKNVGVRAVGVATLITCAACNNATTSRVAESVPAASPPKQAEPEVVKPKPQGTPQPKLPVGTVVLETPPREPVTVEVEVASTDSQRQMGLMFRESLGDQEGMLFLFPTERRNSFWMHNTLIPLDMLFIDSEWKVVGIVERAEPLTDDPRAVAKMSQYVLEVNGGFAARHGLGPDTQVRFTPPAGMNP